MAKTSNRPALDFVPAVFVKITDREGASGNRALDIEVSLCRRNPSDDAPYGLSETNFDVDDPRRALPFVTLDMTCYSDDVSIRPWSEFRLRDVSYKRLSFVHALVHAERIVTKGLAKIEAAAGPAQGSALAYRFAKILGAEGMIRRSPRNPHDWQWLPLEHLTSVIDSAITAFRAKYAPKPTEPAAV